MKTYKELSAELKSNHAEREAIEKELKTMQPPEVWVCFFEGNKHDPEPFMTEEAAKKHFPTIVSKIVRYVLPLESENLIAKMKAAVENLIGCTYCEKAYRTMKQVRQPVEHCECITCQYVLAAESLLKD